MSKLAHRSVDSAHLSIDDPIRAQPETMIRSYYDPVENDGQNRERRKTKEIEKTHIHTAANGEKSIFIPPEENGMDMLVLCK